MTIKYAAFIRLISEIRSKPQSLIFPVTAMLVVSILAALVIYGIVEERKARRLLMQKKSVEADSVWLKGIRELNEQIHYYEDILDNGRSECYVEVNSKAKFDKTDASSGLYEFAENHRDQIECVLERISRNRVIDEMYQRSIQRLRVEPTQEQCDQIGVTPEQFQEWEKELAEQCCLRIPMSYTITCYVTYRSSQGRNYYSKKKTIEEAEIQEIFRKLDSRTTLYATEAWRRKTERAKVTPAVRFRIIQRDGGRCRMCGRSAQDGTILEVDHIIPIAHGGDSRDSNLQTLCRECNRGKGSVEYPLN